MRWAAAAEEIESLDANEIWDLVELPKDSKAHGIVERRKAHLVGQGYSIETAQQEDYDEMFSPVVRFKSLRTVI